MNDSSPVLVVEDNDMYRKLVSTMLRQASMEVDEARTGTEGLEKARALRPRVIVLDMMFPDMSGTEFIDRLCEWGLADELRIVAMTGATKSIMSDELLSAPYGPLIHKILRKPVNEEDLVGAVQDCLDLF